jgi:hypothetical protein
MLVARIISFGIYYLMVIPICFSLKMVFAIYALLIGIKPSGIDWKDLSNNLHDLTLKVNHKKATTFFSVL